jgi:parallel beta-helix repeat protein
MTNVSTSFCENGIAVKPELGNVTEFIFLTNVLADEGGEYGILLDGSQGAVRGVYGSDCWSSSNGGTGLHVQNCSDIKMSGMRCFNNLKHGFHLNLGSDLTLSECTASGNGSFQHPNFHGIVIGNANRVKILGCRSGQTSQFGNHQGYGLFMASPSASSVLIDNCIFSGNITGDRFLQGNFKLGQNY